LFIDCISQYAGGTFFSKDLGRVYIFNCSFLHVSGYEFGGVASVTGISKFECGVCSFFSCTSNNNNPTVLYRGNGGARDIEVTNISSVYNCSFISCSAKYSGVLCYLWNIIC
jgi:hypothetical protein